MIALSCLAASLLMATAVGGSLVAPAPMNVAVLPAVSTFEVAYAHTSDQELNPDIYEYGLVSPVAVDSSFDFSLSDTTGFDINLIFGDNEIALVFDDETYAFHLTYSDGAVSSENVLLSDVDGSLMLLVLCGTESSTLNYELSYVDVNLPDLPYWSSGELYVYVGTIDGSFAPVSYLGLYEDAGTVLNGEAYAELGADVNPIDAIADGLTAIVPLGGAFVDGFDAVFMDGTALTAIGSFAFILMGIGISVGITKKCFNWVTGRHGM